MRASEGAADRVAPAGTAGQHNSIASVAEPAEVGKQAGADLHGSALDAICELMRVSRRSYYLAAKLLRIGCAEPVAALAEYWPHRLTPAGKQRRYRYGLCTDCYAEVNDERTQPAALMAIERFFERHDAQCRPPWERR